MGKYGAIVAAIWVFSTARCGGRTPDARQADPGADLAAPEAVTEEATPAPVPPEVLATLDTCSVVVDVFPRAAGTEDRGPGLRSVLLHPPGVRLEPHGLWPDGTPVSADAEIDREEAHRLLEALAATGFFSRASRHHSEARPSPATPPPDGSVAGPPERAPEPNLAVFVRTHDEDWHSARVASWPLGDDGLAVLEAIERVAGPEAAELLARLRASF